MARKQYNPQDRPQTVREINAFLKANGVAEKVAHQRHYGYYYFYEGDASGWPSSAVYTYSAHHLTLQQWLDERNRLASAPSWRVTGN